MHNSPKSGTPWRLSSSVLWARCPALRELINGFWDEGGGGLELSIDACDEVLAALCRYMHTGMLALPIGVARQLELLRVASELGMHSLYRAASEALQQKLVLGSVHVVIAFCAEHGFADLERTARLFLSSGGKRATVIRYQNANELNPQNAYLRDAIFASLQDVNTVLAQKPAVASAVASGSQPSPLDSGAATSTIVRSAFETQAHAEPAAPVRMERVYGLEEYSGQGPLDPYYTEGEEGGGDYNDASLSLLDIAAGGAGLSRGGSFNAGTGGAAFQDDYLDRNVMNALQHNGTHASYAGALSPPGAIKAGGKSRGGSGGIYGLLLQGAADPALQEYVHPSGTSKPRPSQPAHPASKVPGRVMGDKRTGKANQTGSVAPGKGGAGQKPTAQKAAPGAQARTKVDPTEATPRTQRASSLLASARPSSFAADDFDYYGGGGANSDFYAEEGEGDFNDLDRYAFEGDNSFFAEQTGGRDGPEEFVGRMSLAPSKEPSENEKR